MHRGYIPLLTKGSFAKFYGGQDLLSSLSSEPKQLLSVHPCAMGLSLLSQMLLILFKRKQLQSIETVTLQNRGHTYSYQNNLKNILLSGFNNLYTLIGILVFTGSIGVYLALHYTTIHVNSYIPKNILVFASLLLGMNCLPFMRNKALRWAKLSGWPYPYLLSFFSLKQKLNMNDFICIWSNNLFISSNWK